MKSYRMYCLLSIVLFLASCVDDYKSENQKEAYAITAQIEQNGTRTAVNAQNQVVWTEGDQIGVFGDLQTNNALFELEAANGSSARFTGELASGEQPDVAYYPYQSGARLQGSALSFELPAEYVYSDNSNAPMIGYSEGENALSFKHLCGLMKVTVNNVPEESVQFVVTSEGENPKGIAGTAVVEDVHQADAILAVQDDGNTQYSITYQLTGSVSEKTFTFYIPIPVGEYEKLTVSLQNADGKVLFQKSTLNASIKRAVILSMPTLSCDEDVSYVLADNTIQYSRDDEAYIFSVESEGDETSDLNVLTFAKDTPSDKLPKVGSVLLYSEITEKFPAGFLGKVTSVDETNEGYAVHTEAAALDEAFEQLYMDKTFDLIPEGSEIESTRLVLSKDEDGFYCVSYPIALSKESVSVSGSITNGYKLHAHFEFNNESQLPPYAFVTFQSKATSNFGFGIHAESKSLDFLEIPIASIPLNKTAATLVFTPSIDLSFVAEGEGSLGFDANVEFSKTIASTVLYNQGRWEVGANDVDTGSFLNYAMDSDQRITIEGTVFAGFSLGLNLKLFNNDNVKIGIEPKAGLTETASVSLDFSEIGGNAYELFNDSKLDTSLGINVEAEASADIFKDSDALLEVPVFSMNFFEKPYYFFPAFDDPIINVDNENKAAEVSYGVSRDLIFETAIGIQLYEDGIYSDGTSQENYLREEDYNKSLHATFENLNPGAEYKVVPYISYFNKTFIAAPEATFTLEEEEEPQPGGSLTVTSTNVSNITKNSATLSGLVSDVSLLDGTYEYGFMYGTSETLTAETATIVPVTTIQDNGSFSADISALTENTTYYWRAYLRDSDGNYSYGNMKSFVTSENPQEQKSEREILIEFYQATGGDNWVNNENWCTDAPLEEWHGITMRDGNVYTINLNDNNLAGHGVLSGLKNLWFVQTHRNAGLTGLDVSGCEKLDGLGCGECALTTLDVTGCTSLIYLAIEYNKLTSLDLSTCYSLDNIACFFNSLTSLDLSNCPNLTSFEGNTNALRSINFKGCSKLVYFSAGNNQLTGEIDFSGMQYLECVSLWDNNLSLIRAFNCPVLEYIQIGDDDVVVECDEGVLILK